MNWKIIANKPKEAANLFFKNIKQDYHNFSSTEKRSFLVLLGLIIACSIILIWSNLATANPSSYTEGIVDSPRFINPVLAKRPSERDLSTLVFNNLIKDLTDHWELSKNKKVYTVYLKDGLKWQDSHPLTADDVVFTIKTIQNPKINSPLEANFKGIKIEKIDRKTIKFKLQDAYYYFPFSLNIGLLPAHIWQEVKPDNFATFKANFEPVGNGNFKVKDLKQNSQGQIELIELTSQKSIKNFSLKFFNNQRSLISAWQIGQIDGFGGVSGKTIKALQEKGLLKKKQSNLHQLEPNRYLALFFNLEKTNLSQEQRQLLKQNLNKESIISQSLAGYGQVVETEQKEPTTEHKKPLQDIYLTITLPKTSPLEETADLLKKQWEEKGAHIDLQPIAPQRIQNAYIKPRNYEALLFGQIMGNNDDVFAFWHSSQNTKEGLNLSNYNSPEADAFLVRARQTFDQAQRQEFYQNFKDLLKKEIPVIFIYNPDYLYLTPSNLSISLPETLSLPSQRFEKIENWEINF